MKVLKKSKLEALVNTPEFLRKITHRRPGHVEKDWLYFDLTEAVSAEGCPVCLLLEKREKRQIDFLFYENVNDPGVREKLRRAGGLCKWHTRLFLQEGDALGLSILAKDLISQKWKSGEQNDRKCPLCQTYEENERRVVKAVADYLRLEEFWEALEKSPGFCAHHFGQISRHISEGTFRQRLEAFQLRKIEKLKVKLEEIIRKNDYHSQGEKITQAEAKAIQIVWEFLRK